MKLFVRGMFACRSNHFVVDVDPQAPASEVLRLVMEQTDDLNSSMQISLSFKGERLDMASSLDALGVHEGDTLHVKIAR